jgi:hypothetical protein
MARKASNFATKDFISNMPDNVVTHILDRLPVQDERKLCENNYFFFLSVLGTLLY